MNALVPQNFGSMAAVFGSQPVVDELGAGVQASFGHIGYKGKVWSIRFRGEETALMRDDGDGPRNSIEGVIVQASKHVSKIFYESGYVEGSTAAPDCFSNNGATPDPSAQKKQSATCAACPMNAWGSRITPAGKQGKACQDAKRLAVVPLQDIDNEVFGGPLLLRVPAGSLNDLAFYGSKLGQIGFHSFAVGTRISFDAKEAYPKFVFGAIRPLTNEEGAKIAALRNSPQVLRILSEGNEQAVAAAPAAPVTAASVFEQPPAAAPVQPVAPTAQPNPGNVVPITPTAPVTPTVTQPAPTAQPTTVKVSGFGAMAPVTPQPAAQPVQTAPAVQPAVQDAPAPDAKAFEAGLDDMLGKLLPGSKAA